MSWQQVKSRLLAQADKVQQNFVLLLAGFAICMLGLVLIMLAEYWFGSSVKQEVAALFGLGLVVIGVVLAGVGYISLSVLRLIRFLHQDNPDKED